MKGALIFLVISVFAFVGVCIHACFTITFNDAYDVRRYCKRLTNKGLYFMKNFKRRYKIWKKFREFSGNSIEHDLLVLFDVIHSPSFDQFRRLFGKTYLERGEK